MINIRRKITGIHTETGLTVALTPCTQYHYNEQHILFVCLIFGESLYRPEACLGAVLRNLSSRRLLDVTSHGLLGVTS